MDYPKRKGLRLPNFDYGQNGAYFITICTKNKRNILSRIVGKADPCLPQIELTEIGKCVKEYIDRINIVYTDMTVDKYVIMPDHIHMLVSINSPLEGGVQRAAHPTISNMVKALKVLVKKNIGEQVFQTSFNDHIIRNKNDYMEIWKYIDENPLCCQLNYKRVNKN